MSRGVAMGSRVLIVDDEADICEVLQLVLRAAKYQADFVTSAQRALAVIAEYDLLVTDFRLGPPDVTGLDLARVYKRLRPDGHVILLTGYTDLVSPHVDLVLTKPIDIDRLLSVTKQACAS